jgi:eukaryotic-like serine/threonine-protein kinase
LRELQRGLAGANAKADETAPELGTESGRAEAGRSQGGLLMIGQRIGPYEVVGRLGEGGMGEVYRARDTRLDRDVALKVLPESFATDPDRLARFAREARTLAALNHSHIAQVHGLEESNGAPVLVMELVEGEDLAARIARGPIPPDEALPMARQIAEALEAAHDAGIIHRDLKPANIRVRPDGTVKVLDFGLAKAGGAGGEDMLHSPTITSPAMMTGAGVILGTAAYMSPEQARGRPVDKRTDIWAFGCVLYEMLTGRAPFAGDTVTDVIAAVVRTEPDWTVLPPEVPLTIRRLLARCLEKDALLRLRDVGEARIALGGTRLDVEMPVPPPGPAGWRVRTAGVAAVAVLTTLAAAGGYLARTPDAPRTQKFHVAVRHDGANIQYPVIAPDGRSVAYVARSRIWVQSFDDWEPRELPGTDAAVRPFWSPTGEWIGYFRSEQLLKVPVGLGSVVLVARLPAVQAPLGSASGAWMPDGSILVSLANGPIYRVPDGGGAPTPVFEPPADVADVRHLDVLPNGGVLAAVRSSASFELGLDAIGVIMSGRLTRIVEMSRVSRPRYAPSGHIIFVRYTPEPGLWAVPFSIGRMEATGEAFPIGRGEEPSLARDGTLLFSEERGDLAMKLARFGEDGGEGQTLADPQRWREGVALSADGTKLLASGEDGIWLFDTPSGARQRITTSQSDVSPRFVGTTGQIAFARGESGIPAVLVKAAEVGGEERLVAQRARFPSATADGRRLVFNVMSAEPGVWEVGWVEVDRVDEVHRLSGAHRGARFPEVSPDGRLIAYISGETGRDEVYLTLFPGGEGKWQVSTGGGGWVRFSPRGDRLVYRALNGDMMAVAAGRTGDGTLAIGRAERLFTWGSGWAPFFDLSPDGRGGITAIPERQTTRATGLSIVQHWHQEFVARGR